MKLDPEVRAEIRKMAGWCIVCSLLVQVGFILAGAFGMDAVWGCLIGYALSVGNFFFMSVGITRALETGDEVRARRTMRTSYLLRTVVMLGALAAALFFGGVHWLPIAASLFYVRIIITVRNAVSLFRSRRDRKLHPEKYENEELPAPLPEEPEEEEDGFEKFVGHFAKGAVPSPDAQKNGADNPPDKP